MAARKLQTEIDRTLKKVAEGVELFESIYDKMQASTNQTQKEKLETDLKTQIKKLQRLRDQIKTWVASNDIKDKSALLENRRLIETQMEKFKACEKEMKTKAFSKEGLIQSAKLDPKAQEKLEMTQWVQTCVEELLLQVETAEAEIETLQGAGRKKGKVGASTQERLEDLERLNERRKHHISRLEIVLRLLDNGTLSTERVASLKEDVNYFVEDNANDDYSEDLGIYDDLRLDEEEERFGKLVHEDHDSDDSDEASEDLPQRTPSKKLDEESVTSSKRDESPIMKKASASLQLRTRPPPNPNFAQQPMSSILKAGLPSQPSRPAAPTLPPIKYATAAAAAVASTNPSSATTPATTSQSAQSPLLSTASAPSHPPLTPSASASSVNTSTTVPTEQASAVASSPSLTHPSTTSPFLSSASTSGRQADGSLDSPAISEAVSGVGAGPSSSPTRATHSTLVSSHSPKTSLATADASTSHSNGSTSIPPRLSPLPQQVQQVQQFPIGAPSMQHPVGTSSSPRPPVQPQFPPGMKMPGAERPPSVPLQPPSRAASVTNAFPGSLSDLVVSFESVKQKAAHRMTNLDQVHKMLEGGYASMPQPQDTEKPKYYIPRNPYQAPSYYPQTTSGLLSSPGLFAQLDVETLFYVFYFLPGTYQQYLAAKELKRQSWRFHVKYLTWFQRHSEPQAITDEYEQGVYVYFDWEGSWCQRKKSDFRFEYRYLSED
ncbi:Not1 N-terminal domain, CCR4-Not complex component-domain-containing protein [Amylostereum chailletii]|nr:Not1 N-terminal domain, CCR4-Not complex component-domain-containing protein [Amylostereum chailletii]